MSVTAEADGFVVRAIGPAPAPDPAELAPELTEAGLTGTPIRVELVPDSRTTIIAGR